MTSKVFKATLGASLGSGQYGVVPAVSNALVADTTIVADLATVVADMVLVAADDAVLVADGATPTQAHVVTLDTDVTALNTAVGALNTAMTTFKASLEAAVSADLAIVINSATVTKKNQLRALLRELSKLVETQLVD